MVSFENRIRCLIAGGVLAAVVGLAAPPARAASGAAPPAPGWAEIVPVRQEFPWFIPDRRDRDRDRWDDDHRDRDRRHARSRCLDRQPMAPSGHWAWEHGACRWQNARPER